MLADIQAQQTLSFFFKGEERKRGWEVIGRKLSSDCVWLSASVGLCPRPGLLGLAQLPAFPVGDQRLWEMLNTGLNAGHTTSKPADEGDRGAQDLYILHLTGHFCTT